MSAMITAEQLHDGRCLREALDGRIKQLGHEPTAKDWRRFGREDGRAWAESGRSYYAVEAVYRHHMGDEAGKDQAAMLRAIGDDDECPLLGCRPVFIYDLSRMDYLRAWVIGVCEAFEEMAAL
jgi:hypothetical protein